MKIVDMLVIWDIGGISEILNFFEGGVLDIWEMWRIFDFFDTCYLQTAVRDLL